MVTIGIVAREEDGVLQRTIFEFSKRNLPIESLHYSRDEGRVVMEVTLGSEKDAGRVVPSIRKIYGVEQVTVPGAEALEIAARAGLPH